MRAARPWLVAAAALGLAGLLAWLVYGTPLLGVRHVEVRGTALLDPDRVRDAAAIPDGTPLASLDLGAVQRRVAALTPVRRTTVTRDWPYTVVIEVTERTGYAARQRSDQQYEIMDDTGVVFRTVPADPGLPVVKLTAPGPADASTQAALQVLRSLTSQLRDQLVILVADAPARIRLELRGKRQVIWGDATESPEKAKVATVLLARPGSVIDVSAPQFATVR